MPQNDSPQPENEITPAPPPADPLPNPEPSVPSLDQPDPGVFRHPPATPQQATESFTTTSHPANHPEINLL
jgi:hypothetical protein